MADLPSSTPQPVQVRDLHKSYRRGGTLTPALSGVDLSVDVGECVFLVGPSGCGKSTLLSILGCILTPDRGEVHILGRDVVRLSDIERGALRRERIGFVFQRFQLIRGLSALENVTVPLLLRDVPERSARERGLEMLEAVGLADRADQDPSQMSTGQCQRVALARALVGDPDLILADEPTASLDARAGHAAMQLLGELTTARNKTAIVVTHDHRILEFADRVLHLENGCVQDTDPASLVATATQWR